MRLCVFRARISYSSILIPSVYRLLDLLRIVSCVRPLFQLSNCWIDFRPTRYGVGAIRPVALSS
jgi:hypothetical protein